MFLISIDYSHFLYINKQDDVLISDMDPKIVYGLKVLNTFVFFCFRIKIFSQILDFQLLSIYKMSFLHHRKSKSTTMFMQTGASTEIAKKVFKKGTICGTLYNLFIFIVKFIFCEMKKNDQLPCVSFGVPRQPFRRARSARFLRMGKMEGGGGFLLLQALLSPETLQTLRALPQIREE